MNIIRYKGTFTLFFCLYVCVCFIYRLRPSFLPIIRSTVTGSESPTTRWRLAFQGDHGPPLCTAPASRCLSSPWRASRRAITWASSSTGPSRPTGCFLTAWRTEKVARTASTSPRWRRVPRWAVTSACRRRSSAGSTPPLCGSQPAVCSATPTCVCTTALSSACTSDADPTTTRRPRVLRLLKTLQNIDFCLGRTRLDQHLFLTLCSRWWNGS